MIQKLVKRWSKMAKKFVKNQQIIKNPTNCQKPILFGQISLKIGQKMIQV
jgi:hypothetical protein